MSRFTRSLCVFAIFTLAGCSQHGAEGFGFVARQDTSFSAEPPQYDVADLSEQTASLDVLMREIVQKTARENIPTSENEVAPRMALVPANSLTKSIHKTNDQMDSIAIDLPHTLAAQDIELAALARQKENGDVSQAAYQSRLDAVRAGRRALTKALSLTATQAKTAASNLEAAAARGQTGLEWPLAATKQLARDMESARSQITLF